MQLGPLLLTLIVVIGGLLPNATFSESDDSSQEAETANRNKRIIGGTVASGKEWPFVAMVETKDNRGRWYECSATVISKKHVLTAAHCVIGVKRINRILIVIRKEVQQIKVNPNYSNDIRTFMTVQVKKVMPHPSFNMIALTNDLAVLEAEEEFISEVEPVSVASDFVDTEGQSVLILGFGDYNVVGQELDLEKLQTSDHLRQLTSYTHSFEKCKDAWHYARKEMHVCVGSWTQGIATGDSGGPLLAKREKDGVWMQVGVASFGPSRNNHGKPYVFIKTSHYCRWLSQVTANMTRCQPFIFETTTVAPEPTAPNITSNPLMLIADASNTSLLHHISLPLLVLTIFTPF